MAGDRCFSQGFAGMLRVDGICASWSCGYKLKLELQTKDYFIWAIRIKLFGIVVETSPWFPAPFQPTPGSIIQGQSRRYRHQGNIITPWTRHVNRPFLFEKEGNISKEPSITSPCTHNEVLPANRAAVMNITGVPPETTWPPPPNRAEKKESMLIYSPGRRLFTLWLIGTHYGFMLMTLLAAAAGLPVAWKSSSLCAQMVMVARQIQAVCGPRRRLLLGWCKRVEETLKGY